MISESLSSDPPICPECQTPIPADAPGGICPGCVIDLGLSSRADSDPAGTGDATADMWQTSGRTQPFVAPSPADLNKLFEHLEIESLLGQGGMGAVYKARQISLDRQVAVKILPPYSGNDPLFQERFQREARALARLTHPNIVMVFEFGQVSDLYYFVMEYVDGVNLREAIAAGGLTTEESLKVVPQICEALQFAHDEGIVHRDIKPENIILDSRGRIKIADFGLAKLMESNPINFTLTSTNQVLGTIKYMAPEQIENPNTVDHRSDIYSLGVVFYELLTGELPLGRFDPPSVRSPSNQPLDPVVMRTLEKRPDKRFQQASEVKTAVESVVVDSPNRGAIPEFAAPMPFPAKDIGPGKNHRGTASQSRRMPVVHFRFQKVFAGFGSGKGVLRADLEDGELILDVEIKDFLGGLFHSEFKQVRIAFDHILAFRSEFSWYSPPMVEIQTDYFQEFANLPGAENGKLVLVFTPKEKRAASALCERVSRQLDMLVDEEPDDEPEMIDASELEKTREEFASPAQGLRIAGIIDLVASLACLVVGMLVTVGGEGHIDFGMVAPLLSIWFAACGIWQLYLAQLAQATLRYRTLMIGSIVASILWFHPGALFTIPCTVWVVILLLQRPFRRGFRASEREQESQPEKRSLVYHDAATRIELRSRLVAPTRWLLVTGVLSLIFVGFVGTVVVEGGPQAMQQDTNRLLLLGLNGASLGILGIVGALILRFTPSLFWAEAIARYCKSPVHLLFPANYLIGRSLQSRIALYETENFSRNPYEEKAVS